MSDRLTRLDAARVAAMGWILLHHADDYGGVQFLRTTPRLAALDDWLTLAALGTLFALSGFLTRRYSASDEANAVHYLSRRVLRLYPPFAVALASSAALGVIPLSTPAFLVNLISLGPFAGPAAQTLWFVEVLLFYSAAFAGWLSIGKLRRRPWALPPTMGIFAALAVLVASWAGFTVDARVLGYLPAFAVAAAAGAADRFAHSRSRFAVELLAVGLSGAGVASLLATLPLGVSVSVRNLAVSVAAGVLVFVLATAVPGRARTPGAGARLLGLAAYGSYATYLVHRIAYWAIVAGVARLHLGSPRPFVVASIPFLFVAGILLQRLYDLGLTKVARGGVSPAARPSPTK